MLYVTTRNNNDVFTVLRPMLQSRGPDGGLFLPFHNPVFTPEDLVGLKTQTFNQTVAQLLNGMFGTKFTGWDLDFTIGRYPVRIKQLRHRILIGECWHNPEWIFDRVLRMIRQKMEAEASGDGSWIDLGIRIAVLFGLYGELLRENILQPGDKFDVSCVSGQFTGPISAWYARTWGLPVGNIVVCCNENNELWNLICQGQFRTDVLSVPTTTPLADVTLPENLERLIHGCGGTEEVERFLGCCRRGSMYVPADPVLQKIREGMFVSVISSHRLESILPAVFTTHGYLMSPYTALAYGGLLDYRAKSGHMHYGIVLSERSPVHDAKTVCGCMNISEEQFAKLL